MTASASTAEKQDVRIQRIASRIKEVIQGKAEVVEQAIVAFLAGGHLLLEDVPGVGKTTLANAMAGALGGSFRRIQFTSDMLPSDVVGVTVLNPSTGEFAFRKGPLFANVVLADEINRSPPKTQSALLEAMNERSVSVDGVSHELPLPFMVVATQNPHEYCGTFPLPDSQLDRFLIRLSMGYPDRKAERAVLRAGGFRKAQLEPALSHDELLSLIEDVDSVEVHAAVEDHLLDLVEATRSDSRFLRGVSTRGAESLFRAVKALALVRGRTYSIPEDVRELAVPVLAHRILARAEGRGSDAQAIEELLWELPLPG
jgi:MoxR-like ATPase